MINQMQAVTGRRPRKRYVDIINESRALLPSLYAAKEQSAYQDRMAAIEEDALELNAERLKNEEALSKKSLEQQEEQARKANIFGVLNLGLSGGLGYKKNKILKNAYTSDAGGIKSAAGVGSISTAIPTESSWTSNIKDALKTPGTYGYGALGALGGKAIGGKDRIKAGLWGAGIGAGINFITGGSLTESIISGILGGFGGGFF